MPDTKNRKLRGIVRFVYKQAGRAIHNYKMVRDKDCVLVGFSAGADSVALAKILSLRRRHIPINFGIKLVYINLPWQEKYLPKAKSILENTGLPYSIEKIDFQGRKVDCFWCSWQRRKIFFTLARKLGCNKVALGHNLDDITEAILMNLFMNGQISAMSPCQEFFGGEITVIRPFCYLEKRRILSFIRKSGLDYIPSECPYAEKNIREIIKKQIKELEKISAGVKVNIFRALEKKHIKADYLL